MVLGLEDSSPVQSRRNLSTGETKSLIKAEGLEMDHPRETGPRLGLTTPGNILEGPPKRCPKAWQCPLMLTFVGLVVPRLCWSWPHCKGYLA